MRVDVTVNEWTQCQIDNLKDCDKQTFNRMACHKSKVGQELHCIGWVISQFQNGVINMGLRLDIAQSVVKKQDYDLDFQVHKSIKQAFEAKNNNE